MSKGLFRGTLTTRATHVSIGIISLLGVFDALILVHSKKFRNFMKIMTENEEFLNNNPNLTLRKIHQDGMKNIWPTFNFLLNFVVITITMILFVQTALMHTLRELEHEEECRKSDDCSLLLLETWYCPFGVDDHYWWANIFELACGIICVLLNFERDLYFTNFISYIRCRLRILAYVLHKWDKFIKKAKNEVGYFEEVDGLLRSCLSEHQNIIRASSWQMKSIIPLGLN
ncbi:hypothetical protein WA026_019704 [Henosepilachna vigintioctopunctata]|uniref:Uncharacterized protein n=1 Tax=Henosepilachna vigintioctopunctata TaxID=420089 RepID=A0AAW1UF19_9CUCU